MKSSVRTFDEYLDDCRRFTQTIMALDANAPSGTDIDKICNVMSRSMGMDKCEYEKRICEIMRNRQVDFVTARNILREQR